MGPGTERLLIVSPLSSAPGPGTTTATARARRMIPGNVTTESISGGRTVKRFPT